ncbi:MAG: family 16 glycoside hydrolase [Planctomycetota bacterium]
MNFTRQFRLTGLKSGVAYAVSAEGRAEGAGDATCRVTGGFGTAANAETPMRVRFTVVTGQDYPRRVDPKNGHKVYPQMQELNPSFFVHTGDIEYYDKPGPYADNVELALFKWNRIYAMPFQRDFHNNVASYFMKDDHETLKNDCWPGQTYGDLTWEQGLRLFPQQVPMGDKTYRTVRWGKDLQVWMVEGRDYRSPNRMPDGPGKSIWGEEQKRWLFDSIEQSDATYRVLISPTPIVGPDRGNKNDNHANVGFTHEGDEVRAFLSKQNNLFVVCGDRHWQYVSVDPATGVREYSCGPTTDKHASGFKEENRSSMHRYLKIKGGFLEVEVSRENGEPGIAFRHHAVDGGVYHEDRFGFGRGRNDGRPNTLTEQERADGWALLFDGKTTKGWSSWLTKAPLDNKKWAVQGGVLTLTSKGGGDIYTTKAYENYEFSVEWKTTGNSGLLFRVDPETPDKIWNRAFELQVNNGAPSATKSTSAGGVYGLYEFEKPKTLYPNGWNKVHVRCVDDVFTVWFNGQLAHEFTIGSDDWNGRVAASKFAKFAEFCKLKEGHIGLQDHGKKVQFRNIKIREL